MFLLKRKNEQKEFNNKKRKTEWKHICDLSNDIIINIFTFLDNIYHIDTLLHVNKLFLRCAINFTSWCDVITIKNKNMWNILMKKKFTKINISGFKFDKLTFNNLISVETLKFTNCDLCYVNLSSLFKLKELCLNNCYNLTESYLVSLLEIKTLDGITIESCNYVNWQSLFKILARPLKKIVVSCDGDLSYLDHVNLSNLEVISIGPYYDYSNIVYLENFFKNLHKNNSLHTLTINFLAYRQKITNYNKLLTSISHLKLKYLNISNTFHENINVFPLKCNFELLESLILNNVYIQAHYLITILNNTAVLKELNIGYDIVGDDIMIDINAVLKGVKPLINLKHLYLINPNINDSSLQCFKKFNLQKLGICCAPNITSDDLKYIKDIKLQSLDIVDCCNITDDGLIHLKDMPLYSLSLAETRITDKGLNHLKDLPLTSLNLNRTNISGDFEKYKCLFKDTVEIIWTFPSSKYLNY
jgi:hypothetical protein